jgi:hypothetical protein
MRAEETMRAGRIMLNFLCGGSSGSIAGPYEAPLYIRVMIDPETDAVIRY